MAMSEVADWAMAVWAMATSEVAVGLEGRRQAQLAECSVMAVAAWATGVLALVVKVEVVRAPGERVRAVAAITALVGMVTAVSVRGVAVARAQAREVGVTTAVVARARAIAWAAGVLAVVVKVEVARAPGEPVRAAAAVTALVGRAAALSVKEAAVARARAREPMQSRRQSPSLRHPNPRDRRAQLDSGRCRHCQSFGT